MQYKLFKFIKTNDKNLMFVKNGLMPWNKNDKYLYF